MHAHLTSLARLCPDVCTLSHEMWGVNLLGPCLIFDCRFLIIFDLQSSPQTAGEAVPGRLRQYCPRGMHWAVQQGRGIPLERVWRVVG